MNVPRGPRLPGYEIQGVVGRGGMGVVYRALQVDLDRIVAIKTVSSELMSDDRFRKRFVRESRMAASLEHPNIVPIYAAGEHEGLLYIVMRLVDGPSLAELMRRDGPLDPRLAAGIAGQAAAALTAAHRAGIVHRDVKPANILLTGEPPYHAFLSDFGLAVTEASGSGLTKTHEWIGTLDYAAPEQIRNETVDSRADVYALGAVLFAAVAGRPPFAELAGAAKAAGHVHETPPRLAELGVKAPRALDPVLAKAMAKAREERYQSVNELARAAVDAVNSEGDDRTLVHGAGAPPPPVGAAVPPGPGPGPRAPRPPDERTGVTRVLDEKPPPPKRRRRGPSATAVLASIAVLLAGAALGIVIAQDDDNGGTRVGTVATDTVQTDEVPTDQIPAEEIPTETEEELPTDADDIPVELAMPDVVGDRLDNARQELESQGLSVDVSSGSPLGVIIESNWGVCSASPPPGTSMSPGDAAELFVSHDC